MKRKESHWRERRAEVQAAVGKLGRAHGLVKVDQRRTINGQRVGTVSKSLCIAKINIPTPCQETIQTTNPPPPPQKKGNGQALQTIILHFLITKEM